MDEFIRLTIDWGIKILIALAIFIVGKWLAGIITKGLRKGMEKRSMDPALISFLGSLANGFFLILVVITALGTVGVETTSLAAVLAAAGLAVGLALQGSLANFASGVLIILFKPFNVGDFIDAGGTMGTVAEVGILFTVLNTPDNKRIIAPNSSIMGGVITNFSANPTRRVDMVFGISYSDNIEQTLDLFKRLTGEDERILDDPEPTIGVLSHGDNSINIAVRPWVNKEDYWSVFFGFHKIVKEEFDKAGISIPFPQRDIHIVEDTTKPGTAASA